MKFSKMFLSCSIAISITTATAAYAEQGDWQLFTDATLDGVVESADQQTLNYTRNHKNFRATTDVDDSLFMGDFLAEGSNEVIRFQQVEDNNTVNYLGQPDGSGYQGTWYSTNGQSGDFAINPDYIPTPPDGGDGSDDGSNAPGITFTQEHSNSTISTDGLTATAAGNWNSANTNHAINSGKWYWEVTYKGGNNNIYLGVSSAGTEGYDSTGSYYPTTGEIRCAGQQRYGSGPAQATVGDIYSVMLDMDNKTIRFAVNGSTSNITTCNMTADTVYPSVHVYVNAEVEANFGQKPWAYPALAQ